MSAKAIREASGKDLINRKLATGAKAAKCRFVSINQDTNWSHVVAENPWLKNEKLVVKPDQLIKRRGKLGLIKVNADLAGVQSWIAERMNKDQTVGKATGKLKNFIIEPFVPHKPVSLWIIFQLKIRIIIWTKIDTIFRWFQEEEVYVCIYSHRTADTILFYHEGGVDIGDVDSKALKLDVPVGSEITDEATITDKLLTHVPQDKKP